MMGQRVRAARKMKQMRTDELAEKVSVPWNPLARSNAAPESPV